MHITDSMDTALFYRYKEEDPFTRSFAKFLFFISVFFFIMMTILFFFNLKKVGLVSSLATSGTSCTSAAIAMILIVKGKARWAGALLALLQTSIIILAGLMRTPELSLSTVAFFAFPTILLSTVFSYRYVHISVFITIIVTFILNALRFDISSVVTSPEIVRDIVIRGTVIIVFVSILLYCVSVVTIRSLRLALKISRDETKKSNEKNEYILELLGTIRNSYNELTDSMSVTDNALSKIFMNMETEAATIEQLVASTEEISSSTTSIELATKDQNTLVTELSESILSLSGLIDSLQMLGTDLQKEFTEIAKMSIDSRSSSDRLNEVNRKTLQNSENIQTIAVIIDEFFEKINLLSLNAAIEAARAGEHGRGFAVVADEIGKLADNSSSELKKIKGLIESSRADVEFSNSIIDKIIKFIESLNGSLKAVSKKAMDTLNYISRQKEIQGEMISRNKNVSEKSEFINTASSEQSIAIQEIAKSIENTNLMVQENTDNARSLDTSFHRMKKIADELKQIINQNS